MRGAIPPLPRDAFMAWCLVKHRDKFTFYSRSAIQQIPEVSLPCPQGVATGLYSEPDESGPHNPLYFSKIHSNVILPKDGEAYQIECDRQDM